MNAWAQRLGFLFFSFSFSQLLLNKFLLQDTGNVCFKIIMHRIHILVTFKVDVWYKELTSLETLLPSENQPFSNTAVMTDRKTSTLLIPWIRTFLKFLFLKFLFQSGSTSDLERWNKHLRMFCTEGLYLPRQSCHLQLNIRLCFDFLCMKFFFASCGTICRTFHMWIYQASDDLMKIIQ